MVFWATIFVIHFNVDEMREIYKLNSSSRQINSIFIFHKIYLNTIFYTLIITQNCADSKKMTITIVIFLKATKGKSQNRISLKQQRFLKNDKVKVS